MSDEPKTIGEMTLQQAHDKNVESMKVGVTEGLVTEQGSQFAVDLSEVVRKHLELAGLSTSDFAILTRSLAEAIMIFQGASDLRGNNKRPGTIASMAFIVKAMETVEHYEKTRNAKEGRKPTEASFDDFIGNGVVPNLYN